MAWAILFLATTAHTQQDSGVIPAVTIRNTPVHQVAHYIASLTGKPVLMSYAISFGVDCELKNVSKEELLAHLEKQFAAKNVQLVNVQNRHWKIIEAGKAKPAAESEHVVVEQKGDAFLVDSQAVAKADLAETIKNRVQRDTEVWIRNNAPRLPSVPPIQIHPPDPVLPALIQAKVPAHNIYKLFPPARTE